MYIKYYSRFDFTKQQYRIFYVKLSEEEKRKIDSLVKTEDQGLKLLARMALDNLLQKHYHTCYSNLPISYNENNKPLTNNFYFSMSHSHDYAISVISHHQIGVDIEKIRKVNLNVINYFCSEEEKNYILNGYNVYKNLFTIFCLKEAYLKMIGSGLQDIKKVSFMIKDNQFTCCNDNNLKIIVSYEIEGYVVAIIEKRS